jgi:lipoate-protein ligase B
MKFEWLVLQDFAPIFEKQKQSVSWPHDVEVIWGLEHKSVITLGRRAKRQEEVFLGASSINVAESDRGGLATVHNPGQLIVYPLISLKQRQWGPREYVCQLLKITKTCLLEFGIEAQIDDGQSGLFARGKKICFIGLRVSEGRAYHGLSLNVANDLNEFGLVRACGVQKRPMTNFVEMGISDVSPKLVFQYWEQVARKMDFV